MVALAEATAGATDHGGCRGHVDHFCKASQRGQSLPTFSRSDLAILRSPKLLWCVSLEERHGKEDEESTADNH